MNSTIAERQQESHTKSIVYGGVMSMERSIPSFITRHSDRLLEYHGIPYTGFTLTSQILRQVNELSWLCIALHNSIAHFLQLNLAVPNHRRDPLHR